MKGLLQTRQKVNSKARLVSKFIIVYLVSLLFIESSLSEIVVGGNAVTRIRWGSSSDIDRVTFNPSYPSELGGLAGAIGEPETIGVPNNITGANAFNVRMVTEAGRRNSGIGPYTATYTYDSSVPLTCVTLSCGSETILFSKIRWNTRDNDVLNTVTNYNNGSAQVFSTVIDTTRNNRTVRHRNFYQYIFINDTLLPAGTYEGTVTANGDGTF